MRYEKIFKNADGSRTNVVVEMLSHFNKAPTYRVSAFYCEKGKRTWMNVVNKDFIEHRKMSMKQREDYNLSETIKAVGMERVEETISELWQLIRPQINVNVVGE